MPDHALFSSLSTTRLIESNDDPYAFDGTFLTRGGIGVHPRGGGKQQVYSRVEDLFEDGGSRGRMYRRGSDGWAREGNRGGKIGCKSIENGRQKRVVDPNLKSLRDRGKHSNLREHPNFSQEFPSIPFHSHDSKGWRSTVTRSTFTLHPF